MVVNDRNFQKNKLKIKRKLQLSEALTKKTQICSFSGMLLAPNKISSKSVNLKHSLFIIHNFYPFVTMISLMFADSLSRFQITDDVIIDVLILVLFIQQNSNFFLFFETISLPLQLISMDFLV